MMTDLYVTDLRRAIETDNREAMRTILDLMRRRNVGEASVPGLRELCRQARQILKEVIEDRGLRITIHAPQSKNRDA